MLREQFIVRDFANQVIQGIQNNIRTKDYTGYGPSNNTGTTANSIGYDWDGTTLKIWTTRYKALVSLETGRPPTADAAGSPTLQEQIRVWIDQRGINPEGISRDSLAYLISRKIHREGTIIWRKFGKQGKQTGVVSDFLTDEFIDENLLTKLATFVFTEINERFAPKQLQRI